MKNDFYPRMVPDSKGIVFGTIYDIPTEDVPKMDEWEEEYVRKQLKTDSGKNVDVYIMNRDIKTKKFTDILNKY